MRPSQPSQSSPYLRLVLQKDNKTWGTAVHLLVCEAFHGPRPSKSHHAHHIDGDKVNNKASNLEWQHRKRHFALHALKRSVHRLIGTRAAIECLNRGESPFSEICRKCGIAPDAFKRTVDQYPHLPPLADGVWPPGRLGPAKVSEIRDRLAGGESGADIARTLGLSQATVSRIKTRSRTVRERQARGLPPRRYS